LAGNYDEKCDIWAAGCILYTLLCGYPAFCGEDDQEILQLVVKGQFDFEGEEWTGVSKEAKDLIKKIKGINFPVHIQVFVTPTCPYCAPAVKLAHDFAHLRDLTKAQLSIDENA